MQAHRSAGRVGVAALVGSPPQRTVLHDLGRNHRTAFGEVCETEIARRPLATSVKPAAGG